MPCLLEDLTIFIILIGIVSSSFRAEEVTDTFQKHMLSIELNVGIDRKAHLPDEKQ